MNKKMNFNDKSIDAVKLMREIREILLKKYQNNVKKQIQDLVEIRKKYGFKDGVC